MTTTEALTANPHQPVMEEHALRCAAPECGYAMHVYKFPSGEDNTRLWVDHFKRNHSRQYDPGNAPDITVEWEIIASCSVCIGGLGDVQLCEDGDAVCCKDCGTHWGMDGTSGQRDEDAQ
jgi:hypothetical protein